MRSKQVMFVGANIELGQSHKGLSQSARQFLSYLRKYEKPVPFEVHPSNSVEAQISKRSIKNFSSNGLNYYDFRSYQELADINDRILHQKCIPLNFGGDHSLAVGSVEASLRMDRSTHVVWIDAHADANSAEASFTGSFHGMPVYYLMMSRKNRPQSMDWMRCSLHPAQLTYIGLRDIDPFEKKLLNELQIDHFTSDDIKTKGIGKVLERLQFKNKLFNRIHLSFDIDSLDPKFGLCTGVPALSGLDVLDVVQIFDLIKQTNKLSNFDFVEINPKLATSQAELDQVYALAYQLVHSVLVAYENPTGQHILTDPTYKETNHAFISY